MGFVEHFKIDRENPLAAKSAPNARDVGKEEHRYERLKAFEQVHKEWTVLKTKERTKLSEQKLLSVQEFGILQDMNDELTAMLGDRLWRLKTKDDELALLKEKERQSKLAGDERKSLKMLRDELGVSKERDFFTSRLQEERRDLKRLVALEKSKFENDKKDAKEENDRMEKHSLARRAAKTLAKAVELDWKKPKIQELVDRLDTIRGLLYSEVMLNIQRSVMDIRSNTGRTDVLLGQLSTEAIKQSRLGVESILQAQSHQFSQMADTSRQRHETVIQAINSFTDALKAPFLFPALPQVLTRVDSSLKSAALHGYEPIENAILTALYFPNMNHREAQVQEAHQKTCAWIFEEPDRRGRPRTDFKKWLQEGNGCYWIEGKAARGKSTLMKFLRCDRRTTDALSVWSSECDTIMASCFFWMTGSPLQRDQEGLLRSLLRSILSQNRGLISRVFPNQYNSMTTKYGNRGDPFA